MKAPKTRSEQLTLAAALRAKNPVQKESKIERFARRTRHDHPTFRCFKRALASATSRRPVFARIFKDA